MDDEQKESILSKARAALEVTREVCDGMNKMLDEGKYPSRMQWVKSLEQLGVTVENTINVERALHMAQLDVPDVEETTDMAIEIIERLFNLHPRYGTKEDINADMLDEAVKEIKAERDFIRITKDVRL